MSELNKLVEMAEKVKHEAVKQFQSKDWQSLDLLQQKLLRHRCLQAGLNKLEEIMYEEIAALAKKDGW